MMVDQKTIFFPDDQYNWLLFEYKCETDCKRACILSIYVYICLLVVKSIKSEARSGLFVTGRLEAVVPAVSVHTEAPQGRAGHLGRVRLAVTLAPSLVSVSVSVSPVNRGHTRRPLIEVSPVTGDLRPSLPPPELLG